MTSCHALKMKAADGKMWLSDVADMGGGCSVSFSQSSCANCYLPDFGEECWVEVLTDGN